MKAPALPGLSLILLLVMLACCLLALVAVVFLRFAPGEER